MPARSTGLRKGSTRSAAEPPPRDPAADAQTLSANSTDIDRSEFSTEDVLSACEKAIQYQFKDRALLEAALTHASGADHRLASNERMEFLGDAILGCVICKRLYEQFPEQLEGELTRIKSIVVSRKTCASVSKRLGLSECLILGKGMMTNPEVPASVQAAVLESIVAALYLDGGDDAVETFLEREMWPEIDAAVASEVGGNYKSMLQQLAQREHSVTPTYRMLDEKGPDHSKCFQVAAQIGRQEFAPAWGRTKKDSEQRAAHNAIAEIRGVEPPFSND